MKPNKLLFLMTILTSVLGRSWTPGDPCPTTIKTLIPGGDLDEYHYDDKDPKTSTLIFPGMRSVHSALTTCPNMTSLDLRVTLLGCSDWPDRWNFPFSPSGGDHYPALSTLRLEGYRDLTMRPYEDEERYGFAHGWRRIPWIDRMAQWMMMTSATSSSNISQTQRNKTNLDLWLDAMDFSKLHTLALSGMTKSDTAYFLTHTSKHLTSLERLELDNTPVQSTLSFLRDLSESNTFLTHLKWTGLHASELSTPLNNFHNASSTSTSKSNSNSTNILSSIVTYQPNLQSLDLHTVETLRAESPTIPLSQLTSSLSGGLPNLSQPVTQYSPHPTERLADADATNTTSTCRGEAQYQTPYVDETNALEVFSFLRANKTGRPLTNLTLWAGDWTRPWDGPIYLPPWIEGRRAKVTCGVKRLACDATPVIDTPDKDVEEDWCKDEVGGTHHWKGRMYDEMDDYYPE